MTERTSRKKTASGEKDADNNSITNMLTTSTQGDSNKNSGTNQGNQGNVKNSIPGNQRDSDASKSLGSSLMQDQGNSELSAISGQNQADKSQEIDNDNTINRDQVQRIHSMYVEENEKEKNKNPIIITRDLTEDQESSTSNEIVNAELLDVNAAFKQVPVAKNDSVILEANEEFDNDVDLTDKNSVFKKAMELTMKGDSQSATKYLKVYETLGHLDIDHQRPSAKRASSANPILVENQTEPRADGGIFENGMWFFPNRTTNYQNRSYTPYFDRNIKELRYPIPLTIFDKDWQNKAMGYHAKKKIKSIEGELKSEAYTGLPYADEWLLDYGDWSIHYNGYITALRNAKFTRFVDWSLAHKSNVEKVMSEMGWLTALKYDMRVREEALVNRTEIEGYVAPPNISVFNQVLAEECYQATRSRNETLFTKNPYVEGGERYGWDPATGKPPKKVDKNNQSQAKTYQKWNNNQSAGGSGLEASTSTSYRPFEKKKFQKGYLGNNYDENYKEKKAAAAAKGKQPEK
ncbi:uncharacterized protein MELLADRAFT_79784 [Melampsora larici-populina 98AG31]|uniref:Uncharacterized protein n=1 Tax=Melampsora larici-populina (strain 98AG31 / pathotype 3-4-7) TaxID=747676 RepID=F4SBM3_MELLP|nr:uncharacterized protein MELLADRAFT_79784 [Melampsora larici-populina 98AG31]EGF97960.1 hypothetical protein MELLADRAFT_79784 [Melampsora larici-populina 98AG31]